MPWYRLGTARSCYETCDLVKGGDPVDVAVAVKVVVHDAVKVNVNVVVKVNVHVARCGRIASGTDNPVLRPVLSL
jgi:hypothetical protein